MHLYEAGTHARKGRNPRLFKAGWMSTIQFESLTKIEVLRYMSASFLKIVSMDYDIDFTDSSVALRDSKDDRALIQVIETTETILQRTNHHSRDDEGRLLIIATFKVS